jgi:hypothetical protein
MRSTVRASTGPPVGSIWRFLVGSTNQPVRLRPIKWNSSTVPPWPSRWPGNCCAPACSTSDPAALVHAAVRSTLAELETPASVLLGRLERLKGIDVGAGGFKFGFQLDDVGAKGGATLAQALTELIDRARTDVVPIVDEVQQALAGDDGTQMLLAIKAARDAINPRPGTPGHFLFMGTGSHRAQVVGMTLQKEDPAEADRFLPVIASTLEGAAADVELCRIEDLGALASAEFDRVARADGDTTGLFTADALAEYAAVVRRGVTVDPMQRIAEALRDANLILRKGHGVHAVADPFVQEAWRERRPPSALQ